MEKNQKKTFKIQLICTIVAVVIAIICAVIIGLTTTKAKYDGEIKIEVVALDKTVLIKRNVKFKEEETILEIIADAGIPFKMGEGSEEGMIISIGGINNNKETSDYIMIYVDDKMSEVGLLQIEIKDQMTLSFRLEHFSF